MRHQLPSPAGKTQCDHSSCCWTQQDAMAYDSNAAYADNSLHDHFLVVQFCQLLKQHFFSDAKNSDGAYIVCCFASLCHCAKCSILEVSLAESERAQQGERKLSIERLVRTAQYPTSNCVKIRWPSTLPIHTACLPNLPTTDHTTSA